MINRFEEITNALINKGEFNHCEAIHFYTRDWILFDIWTIHDSNAGSVVEDITYKDVFRAINLIEEHRSKFECNIKIYIAQEVY